jgi:hypothetical protein
MLSVSGTKNPALVSRRDALRLGGISVAAVLLAGSCASSTGDGDTDPLAALGAELAAGPDGAALRAAAPRGMALGSHTAVLDALDRQREAIEADFRESRTVLARGWLLSVTEAAVLVAYAEA